MRKEETLEHRISKTKKGPFQEDGAQSEEGSPCLSQSPSQSNCFEGKEHKAERRSGPHTKKDPQEGKKGNAEMRPQPHTQKTPRSHTF